MGIDIKKEYQHEYYQIENRLKDLEQGFITDLHPHVKMYGSLHQNITQLRKELNELFSLIKYNKPSVMDDIFAQKKDLDV